MRHLLPLRLVILGATIAVLGALSAVPLVSAQTQPTGDLVAVLTACTQCARFVGLVDTAGLTDTLRQPGPLTVWAPTDGALAQLPPATMQQLQQNTDKLRELLRYHLAPGTITAAQIVQVPSVKTVEGESVRITAGGGTVKINEAPVVQADLAASNGIIHVIGGVLIPPSQVQALPNTGSVEASAWPASLVLLGFALCGAGFALRRKLVR